MGVYVGVCRCSTAVAEMSGMERADAEKVGAAVEFAMGSINPTNAGRKVAQSAVTDGGENTAKGATKVTDGAQDIADDIPAGVDFTSPKGAGKQVAGSAVDSIADVTDNAKSITEAATAETVADAALAGGKTRGAAAQFEVDGKTFTDVSGNKTDLHPDLQRALDDVPKEDRAPWHGQCAEVGCLIRR